MRILLVPTVNELKYVQAFRTAVSEHADVVLCEDQLFTFMHVKMFCAGKRITHIATTSVAMLRLFAPFVEGTAQDNIGCRYVRDGLAITMVPPLPQLYTTNSGNFLARHYVAKLIDDSTKYIKKDAFRYEMVTPATLDAIALKLQAAVLCAVDIETMREPCRMTSVAYTILTRSGVTATYVVPHEPSSYPWCLMATRKLNATRCPKLTQNGMYDNLYFITFNCPLVNWRYDTYHLMHCLFPELPKTLHFISGFVLHNYTYWKDESKIDLYMYNAKDTHNTLWAWLGLLKYIKDNKCSYAITNYREEFSNVFPALSCDLEGVLIDEEERLRVRAIAQAKKEESQAALDKLLGQPLNCNSPKQVKAMLEVFVPKVEGTDETSMTALSERYPVVARICEHILSVRGQVKAIGTYFDMSLKYGKLFYHLDPGGTETGRFASKESGYWCGTQIQNIPQYARTMVVFEEGWIAGAVDKCQSESYCTAYLSRDKQLKHTVNTSPDFHSQNASLFFGIPFDEIYDKNYICPKTGTLGKVLRKDIRKVGKTINHGANYNMGPLVLFQNMGTKAVNEARDLLGLPATWAPLRICAYLLSLFDKTYPRIRGEWQKEVTNEINTTGKLTLPTGWVRRTFLRPSKSKLDLNSAIASTPQGLSVQLVNKAFRKIFWEVQHGSHKGVFRIKMQVHDEIVFIARPDVFEQCIELVMELMIVPIPVHGDIMSIPSSRAQGHRWSNLKD